MRSPHPAEGMYGSLRHLVKPILEKISVATRTWTASLKPTNSSLVPTSLKTWYPRSLLLTHSRHDGVTRRSAEQAGQRKAVRTEGPRVIGRPARGRRLVRTMGSMIGRMAGQPGAL